MSSGALCAALLVGVALATDIALGFASDDTWLSAPDHSSLLQTQAQVTRGRISDSQWPEPGDPSMEITLFHRLAVTSFKAAAKAKNVEAINATVTVMCCVPARLDVEEGVYDVIFGVLHDFQDDEYQYVQQNAWRGLSDQSHTPQGAKVIANVGGPNKGIEFMVQQMQAHPEPYYALCADHLTLKYEIMACISGLVKNDDENEWGPAAVRVGLLEQVLDSMRIEPDLIATQVTGCRVLGALLQRNPQYVAPLLGMGALEAVEGAFERFKGGDDTPFHFGFTMGQMYNATEDCGGPLLAMLRAGRALLTATM